MIMKYLVKALISLYDLLPVRCSVKSNEILLVFGGVIGDSVLFCDFLRGIKEMFPVLEGYHITIYTTSGAAAILTAYTDGFRIVTVDFRRLNTDYGYHKQIITELQKVGYDIAINPFPAHSNEADSLMMKARASRKVQLVPEGGYCLSTLEKMNNSIIREKILFELNEHELERYGQVLKYLGYSDFKVKIPVLPPLKDYHPKFEIKKKYCVLAIGGSTPCKQWPGSRFSQVANYIHDNYQYDIVLTGGKGEEHILDDIKPYLGDGVSVHSLIGETSLIDLVEIIRGAVLLVGNDSSSVHIAVAVETKAICVVGGWDNGRMYPYKVDEVSATGILPVYVDKPMPCFNCARHEIGFGNRVCQEKKKNKQVYPCVDEISIEDVLSAVDHVLCDQN